MSAALRKYGKRNGNVIKVLKNSVLITVVAKLQSCKVAKLQFEKIRIFLRYSIIIYIYIYIIIE